jgi:hypothetical protein
MHAQFRFGTLKATKVLAWGWGSWMIRDGVTLGCDTRSMYHLAPQIAFSLAEQLRLYFSRLVRGKNGGQEGLSSLARLISRQS